MVLVKKMDMFNIMFITFVEVVIHEDYLYFLLLTMTMLRGPGAVDTRVLFSPRGHGSKDTGRGPAICTTADIGERFSIFNKLL